MAKRASKLDTVLTNNTTETNNTTTETTALAPVKKPAAKKAAPKVEPEKALDWTPLGKATMWRESRIRLERVIAAKATRKIERIRLEWLYYVASAFFAGLTVGVMLSAWLH